MAQKHLYPLIEFADLGKLVYLAIIQVGALLPERAWLPLASAIARITSVARKRRRHRESTTVGALMKGIRPDIDPTEVIRRMVANCHLSRIQQLACAAPRNWIPEIELIGEANIQKALEEGRGAILWVEQFCFGTLMTKMALHRAGYRVTHLSRHTHGLSGTRFGDHFLNRPLNRLEERYLESRLVMTPANETSALRRTVGCLHGNGIVSITVGIQARRTARVPFLAGRLLLAEGPARLAFRTNAPLIPVFTTRRPDGTFVTEIAPDLIRQVEPGADAVSDALGRYAQLLSRKVLQTPDQYQRWATILG